MGANVRVVRSKGGLTKLTKHAAHQDTKEETRSPDSGVGDHGEGYERLVSFPVVVDTPDDEVAGESAEETNDSCTVPCIPATTLADVASNERIVVLTDYRPTV